MTEPRYILLSDNLELSHLDFKDDDGKDSEKLQYFIKKHAHKHHRGNFGLTYVIQYDDKNIGYVTLASSAIEKKLFNINRKKQPNAPATPHLPSIIIAYFAIDREYRGNGIGRKVLLWVFGLARKVGTDVGCRYITLYAKNAIPFYEKNGYKRTIVTTEDGFALMYKDLYPEKGIQ